MSGTRGEGVTPQTAAPAEPAAEAAPELPAPELPAAEEPAAEEPAGEEPAGEERTEVATREVSASAEAQRARAEPPEAAPEPPPAAAATGETASVAPGPETADEAAPGGAEAQPAEAAEPAPPERPELRAIREAQENRQPVEGRVIGWNNGGFHLAIGELAAFCPRSEMEIGEAAEPESYLDRTFLFRVLRLQGKGRRIVVSRASLLRHESSRQRAELRKKLRPGAVLEGTVASLTDFGAFVDLGGTQGLVHVSEISHRRVDRPASVLSEGQTVGVKVLKVEKGGRRISLSMRALEPDPWKELAGRFKRGAVVQGTVEKATSVGAFVELAPGLTGLLPARSMSLPRETTPARAYPPGKQVSVQIMSIDPRRQRISLALEGSTLEGSRHDFQEYQRQRREQGEGEGFNALASAFRRLQGDGD